MHTTAPAPAASSLSGAVHRTRQRFAGARNNRTFAHDQKPFLDQGSCNNRPRAIEDSRKCRPRNSHPFGGRLLVQTFEISETKRLELISAQGLDLEIDSRAADRLECAPVGHAADLSDLLRPSHRASYLRTYAQNEKLSRTD
jgi:hypothetical protein